MEDHPNRVLAYGLAKLIEKKMLDNVSGGGGVNSFTCSRETLSASGFDQNNWDTGIDVTVDW